MIGSSTPNPCWRQTRLSVMFTLLLVLALLPHPEQTEAATSTTFTPPRLDWSAPEIGNPDRGLYRWIGNAYVPAPTTVAYRRVHWSEVEHALGVYDFSRYDNELQYAAQHGMRLIIGLPQPIGPNSNGGSWMPSYLTSDRLGVWYKGSYYPNVNDPFVLGRLQALIAAIARRYANDTWVSGIQMSVVGAYGEWYFDSAVPSSVKPTDATAHAIIDTIIASFTHQQLFMMVSPSFPQHTIYALAKSPRIGWSRLALGDPQFDGTFRAHYQSNPDWWQIVSTRWKTAPILAELYGHDGDAQFALAAQQARDWHISLVGNGNFAGRLEHAASWTADEIRTFQDLGKHLGYRFVLDSLSLSPLIPGTSFTIQVAWENVGNAPIYRPWKMVYELRDSVNHVVASCRSTLDLQTLLPTAGTPRMVNDTCALPASLKSGTYRLHVVVEDDTGDTLQLASGGKQGDGSYRIGDVPVSESSAPVPVPTRLKAIVPEADAVIQAAAPDTPGGDWAMVRVDAGSDPEVRSYLRFTVTGVPAGARITNATLRLYATSDTADGPGVYGTTSDWSESRLTWNKRPHRTTDQIADVDRIGANSWVSYDVTPLITGTGTFSLVLVGLSADGVNLSSREGAHPPELIVTTS